jgi:hypothetical protein
MCLLVKQPIGCWLKLKHGPSSMIKKKVEEPKLFRSVPLKHLHHPQLNQIMTNLDIQAMISLRIFLEEQNLNVGSLANCEEDHLLVEPKVAPPTAMVSHQIVL